MRKQIIHIFFLFLLSTLSTELCAQIKFSPSKSEYRIGEELLVTYGNLPATTNQQFYLVLVLANNGADLHDSKQIQQQGEGSLKFKRLIKPGNFQVVLYRYKDKNDQRPEQLKRISFTAVSRVFARNNKVKPVPKEENDVPAREDVVKEIPRKEIPKKETPKKEVARKEPPKQTPKKSASPPEPKVAVAVEEKPDEEDLRIAHEEERLDSIDAAEKVDSILTAVVAANASRPAAPPPPTYMLNYPNALKANTAVELSYQFPKISTDAFYQIAIQKQGEDSAKDQTTRFKRIAGRATLDPDSATGIFEVKVFLISGTDPPKLVHSQPMIVGEVNKMFPGRYSCIPKKPVIVGKEMQNGPTVKEATEVFQRHAASRHLRPWIATDDLCIEIQGIEMLPASVVTFPPANDQGQEVSYPAFPFRFIYRIVLNDFTVKRSAVVEEARFKYLYLYRDPRNGWQIADKPGTQVPDLGSR